MRMMRKTCQGLQAFWAFLHATTAIATNGCPPAIVSSTAEFKHYGCPVSSGWETIHFIGNGYAEEDFA